jgi:hypothetical protein
MSVAERLRFSANSDQREARSSVRFVLSSAFVSITFAALLQPIARPDMPGRGATIAGEAVMRSS